MSYIYKYTVVLSTLLIYGFDIFCEYLIHKYYHKYDTTTISTYLGKSVYRKINRLGPAFVKIGQVVAMHEFLLPKPFIFEIKKLLDNTITMTEHDLNKSLRGYDMSIFLFFDRRPFASGSIAQIHKGILNNGDIVAVKIMKYSIPEDIRLNLDVLSFIGKKLTYYQLIPGSYVHKRIDRIYDLILEQINFRKEADVQSICHDQYIKSDFFYVPKVYKQYCTDTIIVMELIDGCPINKVDKSISEDISKKIIGFVMSSLCRKYVHCDLHTSNLLYRNDKICIIDFGLVMEPDMENPIALIQYLKLISEKNYTEAIDPFIDFFIDKGDREIAKKIVNEQPYRDKLICLSKDKFQCNPIALLDYVYYLEELSIQHNISITFHSTIAVIGLLSLIGTINSLCGDKSTSIVKEMSSLFQI